MKKGKIKYALAILIGVIMIATGCNAKKKLVTDIKSSAQVSVKEEKESSVQATVSVQDTTRTKVKEVESNRERIIEEYIFNSDGRVVGYRKETNRSGEKQKDTDTKSGSNKDSSFNETNKVNVNIDSASNSESKLKDKEVTPPNPLWHWIGGAILVGIAIFVLIKSIRK